MKFAFAAVPIELLLSVNLAAFSLPLLHGEAHCPGNIASLPFHLVQEPNNCAGCYQPFRPLRISGGYRYPVHDSGSIAGNRTSPEDPRLDRGRRCRFQYACFIRASGLAGSRHALDCRPSRCGGGPQTSPGSRSPLSRKYRRGFSGAFRCAAGLRRTACFASTTPRLCRQL